MQGVRPAIDDTRFLRHFKAMMGPHGLYQHATIRTPLLREGYCTDDNARAVQVLVYLLPLLSDSTMRDEAYQLLQSCWGFIKDAEVRPGYYHNFRRADGTWIPEDQSEDMYARIVRTLTVVMRSVEVTEFHADAHTMLIDLLPQLERMRAPRFWAECLIALTELPPDSSYAERVSSLIEHGEEFLFSLWQDHAEEDWAWFEDMLTYANSLFPYSALALLRYHNHKNPRWADILHASVRFLLSSTVIDDMFVPIGSHGWYPRGGSPSRDNQQAIEAGGTLEFFIAYYEMFPDKISLADVAAPYLWFFGHNTNATVMVQEEVGSCLDGLFLRGSNPNQGAESMLAYHWAEISLRYAAEHVQRFVFQKKLELASNSAVIPHS